MTARDGALGVAEIARVAVVLVGRDDMLGVGGVVGVAVVLAGKDGTLVVTGVVAGVAGAPETVGVAG